MMKLRLARMGSLVSGTPPLELEPLVRGLLIQYFFHVSQRSIIEIATTDPAAPRTVNLLTPTLFKGLGRIVLAPTVLFGWPQSPLSYRASHVEARNPGAVITIGDRTTINNAAAMTAEGAGIRIGARCLIGTEFQVLDTNAHELEMGRRHEADSCTRQVHIGDDVFIGSRVTLLKGCRLGDGGGVAAGAAVSRGFEAPALSVVAGNPARVVGQVKPPAAPSAATRSRPRT